MTPPPTALNVQRLVLAPALAAVAIGAAAVVWLLAADPTGRIRTGVLSGAAVLAAGTVAAGVTAARSAERRLKQQLDRAVRAAVAAAAGTTAPAVTPAAAIQQVTVLVNIARRLQSLVHHGIEIIDELEQQVEQPDLLRGLFEVDHIATRIRRYVENVAVLGGETTRRKWRTPVPLTLVVRSAIGEVERYSRVRPVPPVEGRLAGSAVADVVHLLAELIENATAFSPPTTDVLIRTQQVTSGVVIEIEDRGLGQRPDEERLRNALLADPAMVEVGQLLDDGRVGLYVVAVLARQHGIRVELRRNIFGGITSLVLLPRELLAGVGRQDAEGGDGVREAAPFDPAPRPAAVTPAPIATSHSTGPRPPAPRPTAALPHPDGRPQLPQRTQQSHLAPQLQRPGPAGAPQPPPAASYQEYGDDALTPADPGLMATYRRGVLAAEEQQAVPGGGTSPAPTVPTPHAPPAPAGRHKSHRSAPDGQ